MPTTFRPYQPDQLLLLSPDLREWLPPGHLAHHVSDLVDALDLNAFYAPYEGDGRRNAPYEPSMMVKVLIYAYATGVFSSRAIARKLEEDVAFRVLGAENFPQHRTICEFRRRHLEDFERMFVEVVGVAREMGVVRFGSLSVDGTKVRANASKRKAMSYGRMVKEQARLKEEIEGLLGKAGAVDAEEDERYGEAVRGDELPAELQRREKRLAAIEQAKTRLEAAQRAADEARGRKTGQDRPRGGCRPYKRAYGEPEPKAQSNFTDPESRIMKTFTEGFQQCYNAHTVVDEVSETFGVEPEVVLADAGYCNEAVLVALEQRGIDGHGARGQGSSGGRPTEASGHASHGREAGKCEGPGSIRQAQVAIGGTERLGQGGAGIHTVQCARGGEGARRVASGVFGAEHQAHEGAGGVLSEPGIRLPFAIGMRRGTSHTNRQPLSLRVADDDAATISILPRLSVSNVRIPSDPAPIVRRHDFYGARSSFPLIDKTPWIARN